MQARAFWRRDLVAKQRALAWFCFAIIRRACLSHVKESAVT